MSRRKFSNAVDRTNTKRKMVILQHKQIDNMKCS